MTDKIIVVTPPDDILLDGPRLLLVNLNQEQLQAVSTAVMTLDIENHTVITFVWKLGDSVEWMLNTKLKSKIIIFNADMLDNESGDLINGYLLAQGNSYYFGNLKDLHMANNRVLYNSDDVKILLERILT
jgi:hypothetical protein